MVTEGETNSHTQLKKSEHRNRASKIKTVDHSSCVSLKGAACLFQVIGKTSLPRNFGERRETSCHEKEGGRGRTLRCYRRNRSV